MLPQKSLPNKKNPETLSRPGGSSSQALFPLLLPQAKARPPPHLTQGQGKPATQSPPLSVSSPVILLGPPSARMPTAHGATHSQAALNSGPFFAKWRGHGLKAECRGAVEGGWIWAVSPSRCHFTSSLGFLSKCVSCKTGFMRCRQCWYREQALKKKKLVLYTPLCSIITHLPPTHRGFGGPLESQARCEIGGGYREEEGEAGARRCSSHPCPFPA